MMSLVAKLIGTGLLVGCGYAAILWTWDRWKNTELRVCYNCQETFTTRKEGGSAFCDECR